MRISVINFSSAKDRDVQKVIRAVNRQLNEDFYPYWHRKGILRLEGPPGSSPNPDTPKEMRGDAIIYLQDEPDDSDAVGYHDLNLSGVPYGFVFLSVAKEMGEDWSITLSHEALELVMDPEANLLTSGPHPKDSGRIVQHWYEVCDAVQAESYLIDGILVSNFVTPLYYTAADEDGCRNDFLGASGRSKRAPLTSFGVAPGGYVGFYDPETGEHETYTAPDRLAQRRLEARSRAGWARRGIRHQGKMSPDMVRRLVTGCATGEPLPGPWFEGFAVDVKATREGDIPLDHVYKAAQKVLGKEWHSKWEIYETTPSDAPWNRFEYDLVPRRKQAKISRAMAFEWSYQLIKENGISKVEPSFIYLNPDLDALNEINSPRRASGISPPDLPGSDNPYWCSEKMRLAPAWRLSRGKGVLIGHPDTGYIRHPEIEDSRNGGPVRLDLGWDFADDDSDALAELGDNNILPGGPNHGTATASVIASSFDNHPAASEFVVGVAPEAEIVPIRVANSVVHFSMRRIRHAIRHAVSQGCQVISMSLGCPFPNDKLHEEIQRATQQGVIIVCAAGNHIPFHVVVYPAHYSEVIAVAASNIADQPWSGSSRGSKVDITAPGESVYRALVTEKNRILRKTSERSSGTSYATAHIAGVCALWISHHGYANLLSKYGARLADAFRTVLRTTARAGVKMDTDDFLGIVDAEKVMNATLPALSSLQKHARRARTAQDPSLENFRTLLPHHTESLLQRALAALFGVDVRRLSSLLDLYGLELTTQLASDQRLLQDFDAQVRTMATLNRKRRNSTTKRSMGHINRRLRSITISPSLKNALGDNRPKAKGTNSSRAKTL